METLSLNVAFILLSIPKAIGKQYWEADGIMNSQDVSFISSMHGVSFAKLPHDSGTGFYQKWFESLKKIG